MNHIKRIENELVSKDNDMGGKAIITFRADVPSLPCRALLWPHGVSVLPSFVPEYVEVLVPHRVVHSWDEILNAIKTPSLNAKNNDQDRSQSMRVGTTLFLSFQRGRSRAQGTLSLSWISKSPLHL